MTNDDVLPDSPTGLTNAAHDCETFVVPGLADSATGAPPPTAGDVATTVPTPSTAPNSTTVEDTRPSPAGAGSAAKLAKRLAEWWRRDTIAKMLRQGAEERPFHERTDRRHNQESRLPADDEVQLGGLVLVEAFTPSTISNLHEALRVWQGRQENTRDRDLISRMERNRSWGGRGLTNLGYVRPPGNMIIGAGHTDPSIPDGVQAVWLTLHHLTPSVAVVTATFTISEEFGDLSDALRTDYQTLMSGGQVVVEGKLGRLRARIPWARPRSHSMSWSVEDAWLQKRNAVDERIERIEDQCGSWFFGQFVGRFAQLAPTERPYGRLMFTKKLQPFDDHRGAYDAAGIGDP